MVIAWAAGPKEKWRISFATKHPINDLFLEVLRRGTLSAVYGFGGLHALLIFTFWRTVLGIFAVLASPLIGFLHGLLVGFAIISTGRTWQARQSLPFYIAVVFMGALVYGVGDYIVIRVFAPDIGIYQP